MSDIYLCSGVVSHFARRLKQYLLLLQFSNDAELVQLFLSFLQLNDLLNFLATSSHFHQLSNLQSVQIRILRSKLTFYEKPKERIDIYTHWLPFRLVDHTPHPNLNRMKEDHTKLLKLNQGVGLFKKYKKEAVPENKDSFQKMSQKKGFPQLSHFEDELHKQDKQLETLLQSQSFPKQSSWSQINENQLRVFQQYREYFLQKGGRGKRVKEYKPNPSKLEVMEYKMARQDYERRKMRKLKEHSQFIPLEELQRRAQKDQCTRLVLQSVYQQERLKQQQEQNVSKLRMPPAPSIESVRVEGVQEVRVLKQSVAGRVFSGIKSVMLMK